MIAEMTGPNGTFRPRSQRQSQQEAQPLIGAHGDMRETDLRTPRQPSPRSSIVDLPPPDLPHRRHEHASSGYGVAESSNGTNGSGTPAGPEIRVESPGGIHPALRGEA